MPRSLCPPHGPVKKKKGERWQSLGESDASHEVGEPRVGAQRIKQRFNLQIDDPTGALFVGFAKLLYSFIRLAEAGV